MDRINNQREVGRDARSACGSSMRSGFSGPSPSLPKFRFTAPPVTLNSPRTERSKSGDLIGSVRIDSTKSEAFATVVGA